MDRFIPSAIVFFALVALAARAESDPPSDPAVSSARRSLDFGKYAEALRQAEMRIDSGLASEAEQIELHEIAGLAAFDLNRLAVAEGHFYALLRLDPDHNLDPFAYPPNTIQFFEKEKQRLAPELEALRQQRRIDSARKKQAEEERQRQQQLQEQRRRQLEELSRKMTVKTVVKNSWLVNFVPFGAGQFQQGRNTMGILLASVEAALAATSVIAYFADASLNQCRTYDIDTVQTSTGKFQTTLCGVPPEHARESRTWRTLELGAAAGFYLLYGYGVVDALYHHQSEVITTQTLDAAATAPAPSAPILVTSPKPFVFLPQGGFGAGLRVHF